jgi:hypothetical protein
MSGRSAIERRADAVFPTVARWHGIVYCELFGCRLGRMLGRVAASYFRCRPPEQFVRAIKIRMLEDIDPSLPLQARLATLERESESFLRGSYRRRWRRQQLKDFRREISGSVPDEIRSLTRSPFVQSLLADISSSRVADQLRQPRTLEDIDRDQQALLREFAESQDIGSLFPLDIVDQRLRGKVLADLADAEPDLVDPGASAYAHILKYSLWIMAQGALRGVLTERNLKAIAGEFGIPYQDLDTLVTWVMEVAKRPRDEQEALAKKIMERVLGYVVPKVLGIHYRQETPLGEPPSADAGVEPAEFELLASQIEAQLHTELQRRAFRVMCFEAQHGVTFAEAARLLGEPEADIDTLRSTKNRLAKLLRRLLE